jgi:hypothetical protein
MAEKPGECIALRRRGYVYCSTDIPGYRIARLILLRALLNIALTTADVWFGRCGGLVGAEVWWVRRFGRCGGLVGTVVWWVQRFGRCRGLVGAVVWWVRWFGGCGGLVGAEVW